MVVFFSLIILAMYLTACAEQTEQNTFTSGNYQYILMEDGTGKIIKYNGNDEILSIPNQLDGHIVTAIGDRAFYRCSSLTLVSIPDSVIFVGTNPFEYCEKLEKVTVSPDNSAIAVIDGVLFSKPDKRLICYPQGKQEKDYHIPSGVQIIGDYAFVNCSNLSTVTIPDGITSIGECAFGSCSSLAFVIIPESVIFIGDLAFTNCSSLTSVNIPNYTKSIGKSTFSSCSDLCTMNISQSVISIEDWAFFKCSSLTDVIIPDSVITIGKCAFLECSSLTTVSVPKSVTFIGQFSFSRCSDNLIITVERDSYAAQYCKENSLNYTYPDSLDWLND